MPKRYDRIYGRTYDRSLARALERRGGAENLRPGQIARIEQRATNRATSRAGQRFNSPTGPGANIGTNPQVAPAPGPVPLPTPRGSSPGMTSMYSPSSAAGGSSPIDMSGFQFDGSGIAAGDPRKQARKQARQQYRQGQRQDARKAARQDNRTSLGDNPLGNDNDFRTMVIPRNLIGQYTPNAPGDAEGDGNPINADMGKILRLLKQANPDLVAMGTTDAEFINRFQRYLGRPTATTSALDFYGPGGRKLSSVASNEGQGQDLGGGGAGGGGGGGGGAGGGGGQLPFPVPGVGEIPRGSAPPDQLAQSIHDRLATIIGTGGHNPEIEEQFQNRLAEAQAGEFDRGVRGLRGVLASRGLTGGGTEAYETRRLRENLDTERMGNLRDFQIQNAIDAQDRVLKAIDSSTGRSLGQADIELRKLSENRLMLDMLMTQRLNEAQFVEAVRQYREGNYNSLIGILGGLLRTFASGYQG